MPCTQPSASAWRCSVTTKAHTHITTHCLSLQHCFSHIGSVTCRARQAGQPCRRPDDLHRSPVLEIDHRPRSRGCQGREQLARTWFYERFSQPPQNIASLVTSSARHHDITVQLAANDGSTPCPRGPHNWHEKPSVTMLK